MKKRIISMLLVLCLLLSLGVSAFAATDVITSASDSRVQAMLDAIDYQNFSDSGTTNTKAKSEIKYFLNDSSFAVFKGGKFNYPNSSSYFWHIDDGSHSVDIRGSTGCCAYSYYVSKNVYGTEAVNSKIRPASKTGDALKKLLSENAQAGEHLRADPSHSVAFVSCTNDGFYCLSYSGDNSRVIRLEYWTFSAFVSYYSGCDIFLYNANTAKNSASTEDWKPAIGISGETSPEQIKYGSSFNLDGVISTNVGVITEVKGYITDANGKTVMSSSAKPNTKSYDINNSVDKELKFGSLAVGTYTYHLEASAKNGSKTNNNVVLIEKEFSVVSSAPAVLKVEKELQCGFEINAASALSYAKTMTGKASGQIPAGTLLSDIRYNMSDGSTRFAVWYNGNLVYVTANKSTTVKQVHNYEVVSLTEPTCTADGRNSFRCTCGETMTETVKAYGHNIVDGKCTRCNLSETDINNRFTDIQPSDWFYASVIWATNTNPPVTTGMSSTKFAPDTYCTRAQVVTFLYRAAHEPTIAAKTNPFADIKPGDWFYDAVLWAYGEKITNGRSATTFAPNDNVTRGEFVTLLWRFCNKEAPMNWDNPFDDVIAPVYYYEPVLWAYYSGVTNGMGKGVFAPNGICTRAQVVTFIHRAMMNDI